MEKEFLNYEQSLALKELGFDEPCLASYETAFGKGIDFDLGYIINGPKNYVLAPLKQQALRFFREKYNMLANVYANASGFLYEWHDTIGGTHRGYSDFEGPNDSGVWDSYEEAEEACINKLIEIVKKNEL